MAGETGARGGVHGPLPPKPCLSVSPETREVTSFLSIPGVRLVEPCLQERKKKNLASVRINSNGEK